MVEISNTKVPENTLVYYPNNESKNLNFNKDDHINA